MLFYTSLIVLVGDGDEPQLSPQKLQNSTIVSIVGVSNYFQPERQVDSGLFLYSLLSMLLSQIHGPPQGSGVVYELVAQP